MRNSQYNFLQQSFKKVSSSLFDDLGMDCFNYDNQKWEIILHSIQIKFRLFAVHIRKTKLFSHLITTTDTKNEWWIKKAIDITYGTSLSLQRDVLAGMLYHISQTTALTSIFCFLPQK